jgi:L-Ala-D/L-Glu epimerase
MTPTTIKKVRVEPLFIKKDKPFTIATGVKYGIENALIILELQNGVIGYGEAAPLEPINGENQATALATLNSLKEFLVGKDVANWRPLAQQLKNMFWAQVTARCAVEMAMLDAFTQTLNVPLYQFFGGAITTFETDYTIDIVEPATAKSDALELAAKGYKIIKTKVGKNLKSDIRRILAIREGAPDCEITLDANQGFTPYEALYCLERLEQEGIRPILFEQPVNKFDLTGMKYVKDNTSVPVCADESVFTAIDALNVAKSACADVINIKIMKAGIVEALDIAAIAKSANIRLMIGGMLETKLSLSASAHIVAGLGDFSFIDLDPHQYPERDPFIDGPIFEAPVYRIPDGITGIGCVKRF